PSVLLNSLKELNGTTQRFSTPSQRVQCLLFTLQMLVVPPSGSILSNSLKSIGLPLACSFSARFLVASINAFDDDGMPHRAVASSRPSGPLRTIGAVWSGNTPGIGARLPTYRFTTRNSAMMAA